MDSQTITPAPPRPGRPWRVVILGGGIAGLATAYYLQQGARSSGQIIECVLVEKESRLGGKIITHHQDGFTIDGGPDSFMSQKPWALRLCQELGLSAGVVGTNDASRRTFILWQGRLRQLPDGVMLVVPTKIRPFLFSNLLSPRGKLRMGLDLFIPARCDHNDETLASFIRRRLGTEALDKIAEPLLGGIHTSDPEQQSLLATFPRFAEIEQRYGSLIRGMLAAKRTKVTTSESVPPFLTLRGGLGELVNALVAFIPEITILPSTTAVSLSHGQRSEYQVGLSDGSTLAADAVVLATPANIAAPLVKGIDRDLTDLLEQIRFVSTTTVSLGYRRSDIRHPLDGFGFLVPSKEGRRISACTWTSTKFYERAPDGAVLLKCFLGRANDEAPALVSEEEAILSSREELRSLMGISAQPIVTRAHRWIGAHPQYDIGHLARIAKMDTLTSAHPGLYLTGSSYRGIGLPDCIHDGQLTAQRLLGNIVGHGKQRLPLETPVS